MWSHKSFRIFPDSSLLSKRVHLFPLTSQTWKFAIFSALPTPNIAVPLFFGRLCTYSFKNRVYQVFFCLCLSYILNKIAVHFYGTSFNLFTFYCCNLQLQKSAKWSISHFSDFLSVANSLCVAKYCKRWQKQDKINRRISIFWDRVRPKRLHFLKAVLWNDTTIYHQM